MTFSTYITISIKKKSKFRGERSTGVRRKLSIKVAGTQWLAGEGVVGGRRRASVADVRDGGIRRRRRRRRTVVVTVEPEKQLD